MNKSIVFVLAAVLGVAGLVVGLTGVSATESSTTVECGSAFSPNDSAGEQERLGDEFGNTLRGAVFDEPGDYTGACNDARGNYKLVAFGLLGLAILIGAMALLAPTTGRTTTP